MQTFRTTGEIYRAALSPPLRKVVARAFLNLLEAYGQDYYTPDDCGYVVLVDRETTDADAENLFGRPWREAPLEGVCYDEEGGCFVTCVLFNNQFGLTILVPDEEWLDPGLRGRLLEDLCPSGGGL